MNPQFSIVICTYNPDERLLLRVLAAVLAQKDSASFECVVVDNNSALPVETLPCMQGFRTDVRLRVIREPRPGLSHARIAGVNEAKAPVVIFVDDDNELDPAYLHHLGHLLLEHPQVGCWGPGVVKVDYIDGAPGWVRKHFSALFQEKHLPETRYGSEPGWPEYYPPGSGLVVKREIFLHYIGLYEQGSLTATDRKGNSMASAGDSQIVWTAVKMGLSAGTSPVLRLVHIIPAKRVTLDYLKRLNYGVSSSYYKALYEMFPGIEKPFRKRSLAGKCRFTWRTFLEAKGNPVLFTRLYAVKNAWTRGYEDVS